MKLFTKNTVPTIIILIGILIIGSVKLYESRNELFKLLTTTQPNKITSNIKTFEDKFNDSFSVAQESFVDINTAFENLQGTPIIEGPYWDMAKDQHGKLHRLTNDTEMEPRLKAFKGLLDYNNKKGIKTLVAMVPPSIHKDRTKLPYGVEDYSNKLIDEFLNGIKNFNVPTLDMRESFEKDSLYDNSLYFKYDHHWTIKNAFNATTYLKNKLNEEFKLNLDPQNKYSDINNYNVEVLKDIYKGSMAKALGRGVDDFELIYPKFETKFTNTQWNDALEVTSKVTGPFDESLIYKEKVYEADKAYSAYLRNAPKQTEITNHMADNNLKVLMITTSHGKPLSAFLSSYFKGLSFIDLQPGKFNRNVYNYIDEYKPDIVVFMYSGHAFGKKVLWQFDRNNK